MDHQPVGERARFPRTRGAARLVWALSAALGCGHPKPEAETPAAVVGRPSPDPAPGARPEERNRQLEAQWTEVIVKAKKTNRSDKTIVAAVKLVEPKLRLYHAAAEPEAAQREAAGKEATPRKDEVIDLAGQLRRITPLDVDHIDILNGQVAFTDVSRQERPELWLHELNLSVENLTTRVHLTDGRPTLLTASGVLGRSGAVSIFVTANAFEKGLTFSGRAAIVGLETAELHKFVEPATDLQAPRGTIDIFVEFDCRNGELTGGVKPVLKNVDIQPGNGKIVAVVKAWAADLAVKLFSDRVPERSAVATVIPIKGDLTGPDVQLWPALFGVMRNAFVEGLTSGYAHLPPVTSSKKESVLKQGLDALGPKADVPKAQPVDDGKHDAEPAR
jgi:hypothetical protein